MARGKGKTYPSDNRRWFRIESEEFATRTAALTDSEFRAFVLILAWANENKAQNYGDRIFVARSQLLSLSPNSRDSVAKSARTIRELSAKMTWTVLEEDAKWTIRIKKYSQKQGFAPTKPRRRPNETPATTPTPKTTTTTKRESESQGPLFGGPGDKIDSKASSSNDRVVAAWPAIRAAFSEHGRSLSESPGADRIALILKRIAEGRTDTELVAAVHGYVVFHGGLDPDKRGYNPRQYFRVETIFKAEGFSDRVDLGMGPRDAIPKRREPPIPNRQHFDWKNHESAEGASS